MYSLLPNRLQKYSPIIKYFSLFCLNFSYFGASVLKPTNVLIGPSLKNNNCEIFDHPIGNVHNIVFGNNILPATEYVYLIGLHGIMHIQYHIKKRPDHGSKIIFLQIIVSQYKPLSLK